MTTKNEYELTPEYLAGALGVAREVPLEKWTYSKTVTEPYVERETRSEETLTTNLDGKIDLSISYEEYQRLIHCDKSCRLTLESESYRAEWRKNDFDDGYSQVYSVYKEIQERIKSEREDALRKTLGMRK